MTHRPVVDREDEVADPAGDPDRGQTLAPRHRLGPIGAPGRHGVAVHLRPGDERALDHRRNETLGADQAYEGADGEGAAAEAEQVDLVARLPVPAEEAVELADVRG